MLEEIKEIVAESLNVDADEITAETSFKEDLDQITTVGAVIEYLEK